MVDQPGAEHSHVLSGGKNKRISFSGKNNLGDLFPVFLVICYAGFYDCEGRIASGSDIRRSDSGNWYWSGISGKRNNRGNGYGGRTDSTLCEASVYCPYHAVC